MIESQRSKNKKLINDLIRVDVIRDEIEYAKSQLQPHDTGHIHTAIGWMESRLEQLQDTETLTKSEDEVSKRLKLTKTEDEAIKQQQDPRHNQSAFKGHR